MEQVITISDNHINNCMIFFNGLFMYLAFFSGKSTLIDAITFGLGECDYDQLRIDDLSELLPHIESPPG